MSSILTDAIGASDPGVPQGEVDRQINTKDYDLLCRISGTRVRLRSDDRPHGAKGKVLLFFARWHTLLQTSLSGVRRIAPGITPRVTDIGQIGSVTTNVWQPGSKQTVAVTLGWDWTRMGLTVQVQPGQVKTVTDKPTPWLSTSRSPLASAPRRLISELFPNSIIASPALAWPWETRHCGRCCREDRRRRALQFGGYYRITSSTDSIDSGGYRTQFDVRKEIWFTLSADGGRCRSRFPPPTGRNHGGILKTQPTLCPDCWLVSTQPLERQCDSTRETPSWRSRECRKNG